MMKIGHRGAPGNPRRGENTIASFQRALNLGADAVEFDVRRCADEIVVFHDKTLQRMTCNGWNTDIAKLTHKALNEICAAYVQETGIAYIPRFYDILMMFGGRCFLHIELKEQGLVEDIKNMILNLNLQKSVCISAFDFGDDGGETSWKELMYCMPEIKTALLATSEKILHMDLKTFIQTAKSVGYAAIHPEKSAVTKEMMLLAEDANLCVNVWTVNDPAEITHLKQLGVDGIISDFPEQL